MKILITGASGFIGKHLVDKLQRIHEIVGVDQNESEINGQKIWPLDLLNQSNVVTFLKNREIDAIVHLAAQVPPSFNASEAVISEKNNLIMTQNLLEVFKDQKIGHFIFASGISVLGEDINGPVDESTTAKPTNPYTQGKYECELLAQKYETSEQIVSILRISAPYGLGLSGHTLISKFIQKVGQNKDLTIFGTGSRSQDFINVADVCEAINCSIVEKASGIFNIASGQTVSVKDLAQMILNLVPESESKITFTDQVDPQENYRPKVDVTKAKNILKFKANIKLIDGLKDMILESKQ